MDKIAKDIGKLVIILAAVIIAAPLAVLFGYITGFLLKIFVGGWVVSGLNILFNTDRFSPEHLPALCSALSFLGVFFKSSNPKKEDK